MGKGTQWLPEMAPHKVRDMKKNSVSTKTKKYITIKYSYTETLQIYYTIHFHIKFENILTALMNEPTGNCLLAVLADMA
jgi:hypothetical protein